MYEKMVERLRKAAGPTIDFPDTLYDEAADAIEELMHTKRGFGIALWSPSVRRKTNRRNNGIM